MYKKAVRKFLLGIDTPQEYVCVGLENFPEKFKVFLSFPQNDLVIDVTGDHVFLGYKPLVIGVAVKKDHSSYPGFISSQEICLSFNTNNFNKSGKKNGYVIDENSCAKLVLKKIHIKDLDNTSLFIFEGLKGEHKFLSSFHQFTNRLFQSLKSKGANNVGLPGNLYEQVRIAYSIPRIISIISLGENNSYNMFPTDLHGQINKSYYVSSLRHEGKVAKQVEETRALTLSNVSTNAFREAYAMGKNHMQNFKHVENFKVSAVRSLKLNNPLNPETISYLELEVIDSFDVGIHRIFFYKIVDQNILESKESTLSHIHQYYQTWRNKKGINTKPYIR